MQAFHAAVTPNPAAQRPQSRDRQIRDPRCQVCRASERASSAQLPCLPPSPTPTPTPPPPRQQRRVRGAIPTQPHLHPSSKVTSEASGSFVRWPAAGPRLGLDADGRTGGRNGGKICGRRGKKRPILLMYLLLTLIALLLTGRGASWRKKLALHTCSSFSLSRGCIPPDGAMVGEPWLGSLLNPTPFSSFHRLA